VESGKAPALLVLAVCRVVQVCMQQFSCRILCMQEECGSMLWSGSLVVTVPMCCAVLQAGTLL
jgi:hypothetical protein